MIQLLTVLETFHAEKAQNYCVPHQVKCVLSCSWADLFICFIVLNLCSVKSMDRIFRWT